MQPQNTLQTTRNRAGKATSRIRFEKQPRFEQLEDRKLLAGFDYPSFNTGNTGDISLLGSASITSNRLRLTPALGGQNGAAWYTTEKQIVGASWESNFQFQLNENFDSPGGSDGFVFIIQNTAPTYLAGGGGTLGYDGLQNSLAVEFDAFQNSEASDPSGSHISVHTNGTGPNGWSESLSLGSYNTNPIIDDANVHTVKIKYSPGTLSVYLDNLTTPKLTVNVDLGEKLNLDAGRAWVGFTAATGGGWQNHDILNWNYNVLSDVSTTLAIKDKEQTEGNSGISTFLFDVSRSGDVSAITTVNWTTSNGTATAGSDYVAASGQITFSPLETSKTIAVTVLGDTLIETHETFKVKLSDVTGAAIVDGVGIGTILTDEVSISIGNDIATEGAAAIRSLGSYIAAGFGGLVNPYAMVVGPDGKLYVSGSGGAVYRFDAITGVSLPASGKSGAEFVSIGDGGFSGARDIAFGPDGFLYAVSENTDSVLRYNPTTGTPEGRSGLTGDAVFIAPGAGGLDAPRGLIFNGGYAYVTSVGATTPGPGRDSVLRFNAVDGTPAGVSGLPNDAVFIASGSGGLDNPSRMVFGPDGRAYVSSTASTVGSPTSNSILRFDPTNGAPAGVSGIAGDAIFVAPGSGGLDGPAAMVFRPDGLYVTGWRSNSVHRYQSTNGAFSGQVVASGSGGLNFAVDLLFETNGNLLVSSKNTNQIIRYGAASQFAFTVGLSSASGAPVKVNYTTSTGSASDGSDYESAQGILVFSPGEVAKSIIVQTRNDANIEINETLTVVLSNASGGVIALNTGVGTILDDDTKFYVVDDSTVNRSYEYGDTFGVGENYTLAAANSTPRGAASTAAGNKVWVVDNNRNVYVYDPTGKLLGSWTAGTMTGGAQPEGITTDGNDVWIVDNKTDKVFKYAGAAKLLSGSQSASASPFPLATDNKNPKDLVTDGTYIWVVDDGASIDKVFRYDLNGSNVKSWTIDSANKTPTGLTIDPTTGSSQSIWIVDSGTRKVYEYTNARGKTSGSQSAAANPFALASGNTNPQGIADPPPPSASLNTALGSAVSNSAFSSSFLQAPIVLLGVPSTERVASQRSVLAVTEGVDETMSQLASWMPAAPISTSNPRSIPFLSRPRFPEDQSIDLALTDEELNDSFHAIANDLLKSTLR